MKLNHLQLKKIATGSNRMAIIFFIRLSVIFSVWFFVYGLYFSHNRIIDKPVTNVITAAVAGCINLLPAAGSKVSWQEDPQHRDRNFLIKDGIAVFGIFDVCNGLDLIFIYISVIVLLPFPVMRKIAFSICGTVAIILANIVRVFSLYFIYIYKRSAFDFSHHYLFTILMYLLIFYGWILFINKKKGV